MIDCIRFSRRAARRARFALFVLSLANPAVCRASIRDCLEVGQEISVPDAVTSTGAFVGSLDGVLVVAGGTRPVEVGNVESLEFSSQIWTRDRAGSWTKSDVQLTSARAFGCSVSMPQGIVCIGGRDAAAASSNVELIQFSNGALVCSELPKLPTPTSGACAARLGNRIYVAGGYGVQDGRATAPLHRFVVLDLDDVDSGWQDCAAWPGPARAYAVAASQSGAFLLIGGSKELSADGKVASADQLRDAFRFAPAARGSGGVWREIDKPPFDAVGAASPAVSIGQSHIVVVPAPNLATAALAQAATPMWWYHTITNTWTEGDKAPPAQFATSTAPWEGGFLALRAAAKDDNAPNAFSRLSPKPRTASLSLWDYLVIGGYFSALPLIGWYCSRKSEGTDDFFLGGHRIPWWAAGISIYSTMLSGITYMGIPALSYASNWTRIAAGLAPILVAPIVIFYYVPFFCRLEVTSAYEYLERRFNLIARLLATTLFLLFQLGRVAIVVSLPALALSAVTGMSMPVCILLTGVVATLYTYLGGIEAVIWVDVLQVGVLIGGAILTLSCVVYQLDGGWSSVFQTGVSDNKFQFVNLSFDYTQTVLWVIVIGAFFESLYSYSSDQTIIQRYLTTKDESSAARSLWTNAALSFPCLILMFMLGSALYAYYKSHPEQANPLLPTDAVFPLFVSGHLPAGLVGLVIAGIFAASMDNLPSSVTCMTTAIVTDFFLRFRPDSTDQARLRLARFLTVILGALGTSVALLMTRFDIKSQVDQYAMTIGLFAGGVAGIFALGIFTTRANGVGGLTGLVGSAVVQFLVARYTPLNFLLYSVTGAVSCFVIGYVVSLLIPVRQKPLDGLTIHTLRATAPEAGRSIGWSSVAGKPANS